MKIPRLILFLGLLLAAVAPLAASEVIPPTPPRYFNDYTGTVSSGTAATLNAQLEQFERDSSNQVVVAVYPYMQSDSSIEDYTVRVAQAWHVGQKGRSNGAVLFVFKDDHKMYLQVGYGLESVLPDVTAKRIFDNELKPAFRAGDFDRGLRAGVSAIIAATKGEYKGTGRTRAETAIVGGGAVVIAFFVFAFVIIGLMVKAFFGALRRPQFFGNPYRRSSWGGSSWSDSSWSSGSSSWSSSDSGGGSFSSGGGDFGGGGAGGSW